VLAVVGPGLLVEPGLGLLGVAGILTAEGVWKYRTVVKLEQPVLLQAFTFQRYGLPEFRATEYDVLLVLASTTNTFVDMSLTPTPYVVAPLDAVHLRVTEVLD
jgi:hypothetical protein